MGARPGKVESVACGRIVAVDVGTGILPCVFHHYRQAGYHHVQETAHEQAQDNSSRQQPDFRALRECRRV